MDSNSKSQQKNYRGSIFPFSMIYRELKENLASRCGSIVIIMQERSNRQASDLSNHDVGPWIKDNVLHSKLTDLKGWADIISKSCTKLTLVVTKVPTEDNLKSILSELSIQVSSYVGSYMSLTECSLGDPLFLMISTCVRGELLQVTDLVSILSKGALANANSATGMVWKTCENVQAIPLSNKGAYRRALMENIAIVKDTVREFDEYICIAKSKMDTMMNTLSINSTKQAVTMIDQAEGEEDRDDDGDDMEQDDDDDEDGYELNDILIVDDSIAFLNLSLETLKTGLAVMTLVADKNSRSLVTSIADLDLISTSTINATDSNISSITSLAFNTNNTDNNTRKRDQLSSNHSCDRWVAEISFYSKEIENGVTDFGAALYPPLHSDAVISLLSIAKVLKDKLIFYSFLVEKHVSLVSEDCLMIIPNISGEVHSKIVVLRSLFSP